VAALYQYCSGELVLQNHDDVKRHWVEKCCNKFKNPAGNLGHPTEVMIKRCQWIQEQILGKASCIVMGVDSGGDDIWAFS